MEPLLARFFKHMPSTEADHNLSPQEALFYLFAGYSYFDPGSSEQAETNQEDSVTDNTQNS